MGTQILPNNLVFLYGIIDTSLGLLHTILHITCIKFIIFLNKITFDKGSRLLVLTCKDVLSGPTRRYIINFNKTTSFNLKRLNLETVYHLCSTAALRPTMEAATLPSTDASHAARKMRQATSNQCPVFYAPSPYGGTPWQCYCSCCWQYCSPCLGSTAAVTYQTSNGQTQCIVVRSPTCSQWALIVNNCNKSIYYYYLRI